MCINDESCNAKVLHWYLSVADAFSHPDVCKVGPIIIHKERIRSIVFHSNPQSYAALIGAG